MGRTYAALQRAAVDIVTVHLADGHGRVLVGVHLNKRESSVSLETRFDHEAEVLEQRHHVVGGCIGRKVSDVDSGLPAGCLSQDDFVTSNAMCWKLVVSVRSGRGHAHCLHSLLLGHRGLSLLVCPIAPDGSRPEPLAVHGAQGLLSLGTVTESNKTIASRSACLHIPHNTSLRDGAKGRESLKEDFVVDLVGQIANKDVKVVRSIFLVRSV